MEKFFHPRSTLLLSLGIHFHSLLLKNTCYPATSVYTTTTILCSREKDCGEIIDSCQTKRREDCYKKQESVNQDTHYHLSSSLDFHHFSSTQQQHPSFWLKIKRLDLLCIAWKRGESTVLLQDLQSGVPSFLSSGKERALIQYASVEIIRSVLFEIRRGLLKRRSHTSYHLISSKQASTEEKERTRPLVVLPIDSFLLLAALDTTFQYTSTIALFFIEWPL